MPDVEQSGFLPCLVCGEPIEKGELFILVTQAEGRVKTGTPTQPQLPTHLSCVTRHVTLPPPKPSLTKWDGNCPRCGEEKDIRIARNFHSDSTCGQCGATWHRCMVHRVSVPGHPPKNTNLNSCTCIMGHKP